MDARQLEKALTNIKEAADFKKLDRAELGRDYNFTDAAQKLQKVYSSLAQVAAGANLLDVADDVRDTLYRLATRLEQSIVAVFSFKLRGNEAHAPEQYKSINDTIYELYNETLTVVLPLVNRIELEQLKAVDPSGNIQEVLAVVKEINKIKEETKKSSQEVAAVLQSAREAAGETGTTVSSTHFAEQAKIHGRQARYWLIATVLSIVAVFALVVILFTDWFGLVPPLSHHSDGLSSQLVQDAIARIALLLIAYFVVHQTLRNYKIHSHLYILNQHRQLALTVYPAMVKAAGGLNSDLLLEQAGKAIFTAQTSGFLHKDSDATASIGIVDTLSKFIRK